MKTAKRMTKRVLTAMLCLVVVAAMVLTLAGCPGGGRPVEDFPILETGETIYILPTDARISVTSEGSTLQNDELIMATSIQGLLARDRARLYIGSENDPWVEFLTEEYDLNFEVLESLDDLFETLGGYLENRLMLNLHMKLLLLLQK